MKFAIVNVKLSELHTQQLVVAPWEVPVLQAAHGDNDVSVVGEKDVKREPPDAADEFERLRNRYRAPAGENAIPYVVQVYGSHGAGVNALADAIDKAAKPKAKQKDAA